MRSIYKPLPQVALATTAGILSFANTTLHAQAVSAGSVAATLEEVVVTARRREESLLEVPVAVSVLSGDLITAANVVQVDDIYNLTPGADFTRATNGERAGARPAIRGVQGGTGIAVSQKVSAFLDGMPMIGSQGAQKFSDIERVEILRGPQSASFGRAVFAGAINYVSKDPTEEFEGTATVYGSDQGRRGFQTFLGGPLSDTWGYTLSMTREDADGPNEWRTTQGIPLGGEDTFYAAAKLKWTPTDRFDAEFRVMRVETLDDLAIWWRYNSPGNEGIGVGDTDFFNIPYDQTPWARCANTILPNGNHYIIGEFNCSSDVPVGGVPINPVPSTDPIPAGYTQQEIAAYDITLPGYRIERDRFQAEFTYDWDFATLQVLTYFSEDTSLSWRDNDLTSLATRPTGGGPVLAIDNEGNPGSIEEEMLEARLVSDGGGRLRWMIGASLFSYDFSDREFEQYALVVRDGMDLPADGAVTQYVDNWGVYGSIEYDVTDRLTLSFEGRQQTDEITFTNELAIPRIGYTVETDTFQPRLGLTFAMNDSMSFYGQISQGSNPAGVLAATQTPGKVQLTEYLNSVGLLGFTSHDFLFYPEEEMTNYEFGIKGTVADGRVSFATAFYLMDWAHYNQRLTVNYEPFALAADQFARDGSVPGSAWDPAGPDGDSDPTTGGTNAYEDLAAWYAMGRLDGSPFSNGDNAFRGDIDQGDVTVKGIEAEVSWAVNDNWSLRGVLTLQDASYDYYCSNAAVTVFGQTRTNSAGDGTRAITDCVDVSGNSLNYQSDFIGTLSVGYRNQLGNTGWNWNTRLDWTHRGKQPVDDLNWMYLPPRDVVNWNFRFRNPDESIEIAITARNLTDDYTTRSFRYNPNSFTNPRRRDPSLVPTLPRELGASITFSF